MFSNIIISSISNELKINFQVINCSIVFKKNFASDQSNKKCNQTPYTDKNEYFKNKSHKKLNADTKPIPKVVPAMTSLPL